jgi:NTE family protein
MADALQQRKSDSVAIVFSGGVGLGAYQAGAFARLQEEPEIAPVLYAGSSTGAVNAAIILGSPPERRVEHLRKFWSSVVPQSPFWPWPHGRHWLSAIQARLFGVQGQFRPRLPEALGSFSSFYDLSPMRERLADIVDFELLNASAETLCVATTDMESGELVLFDSRREQLRMEHLLATCGFIPEFAPVEIDGRLLGDGGLSANVPIEAVLFESVGTVFVLDCFARDGKYSPDLETALARKNDLIYGNQTLRTLALLIRDRMQAERLSAQHIICMSYRPRGGEAGSERLYDYSSDTIELRWQSGASDMAKGIECFRALKTSQVADRLHIIR